MKVLGVTLDRHLTFEKHVSAIARSCNYHNQATRHIRHLLTTQLAQTLACSLILSRLDYWSRRLARWKWWVTAWLATAVRSWSVPNTMHRRRWCIVVDVVCDISRNFWVVLHHCNCISLHSVPYMQICICLGLPCNQWNLPSLLFLS